MIIGITGYVGSGKSTLIKIFNKLYNVLILSTDDIAKKNISSTSYQYVNNDNFLNKDDIDNVKNNIHPKVWKEVREKISSAKGNYDYIIVETALPTEPFFQICDKTICIQNNIDLKLKFLSMDRNYTDNKVRYILSLQEEYSEFYKKCDVTIDNNGDIDSLEKKIIDLKEKMII